MTKIKIGGTAIVLILAWFLVVPMFNTQIGKDKSEDLREVVVAVDFEPTTRDSRSAESVAVTLIAGPDRHPLDRATKSPWIRTVYVRKGQRVWVQAQQYYGHRLGCVLTQVGAPIKSKNAFGPSIVTCEHTAI